MSEENGFMSAREIKTYHAATLKVHKAMIKNRLRIAIETHDKSFIYHFCLAAHPAYRRAADDLYVYGQSSNIVDESYVKWVLRYYRRLTGKSLFAKCRKDKNQTISFSINESGAVPQEVWDKLKPKPGQNIVASPAQMLLPDACTINKLLDSPECREDVANAVCHQMGQDENSNEDIAQAAIEAIKRRVMGTPGDGAD